MGELGLVELAENFGSEDRCHSYLEAMRWPEGVRCPRCESDRISRIVKRRQFDCDSCRYQFSVRVGTIFHDSHLPLFKWFLAVYLIAESKKGISAKQLQRMLKVSYKTAWYLAHRIRDAMGDADELPLVGIVEVDETYMAGRSRGIGTGQYRKHQALVVGAAERDGNIRLRVEQRGTRETLHQFIRDHVAGDVEAIYTDENRAYRGIADSDTRHETVNHYAEEWVRGDVHTNTIEGVWSLFKRSLIGSYHHLSLKHLPSYLDELEWRYNQRDNPYLFRDTLLRLIDADAMPYAELIAR